MQSIISVVVLSSLLSLYHVEAQPDPGRVCSQTKFRSECVASVSKYTSGAVDGHSALRAGLQDLADQARKAIAEVEKMTGQAKGARAKQVVAVTLARLRILVGCTKKAMDALPGRDYATVKKQLGLSLNLVDNGDPKDMSQLNDLAYQLNKVANNNFDILMNVVIKPTSLTNGKSHIQMGIKPGNQKEGKDDKEDD